MKLTRLAVRRPVGVTMCVLAFILLSAISLQQIGVDLLPNLELPIVAIAVVYPGADPQTVETTLTDPVEDAVSRVADIRRIRSISMENASLVMIDFNWGADMDAALRDLETSLAAVGPMLPQEATAPIVIRTDPSQLPITILSVSGASDAVDLTQRVEQYVLPRLESLPGVASVEIFGGAYEEIAVRYDSEALQHHGVTPTLLYQILRYQNTVVPSGAITEDGSRYQVRAGRRIATLDDLKSQPIAQRDAAPDPGLGIFALAQSLPVQLREVADVTVDMAPRSGETRVNGEPAVLLRVLKASGANTVRVADRVRAEVGAIEQSSEIGLSFDMINDQSDLIRDSLQNVSESAVVGAVLAVAVLFLFLRSLTSILVIAVAIPLSLIGAVAVLHLAGITLNLMSLGGLAIAVGMLVDNAIVVIENMTRHRQMGKSAEDAAAAGGSEIAAAVVASTLTTLVVFVPITFLTDLTGQLFKDMALAVSGALLVSLIVALTVTPSAFGRWDARRHAPRPRQKPVVSRPRVLIPQELPEAAATSDPDLEERGAPNSAPSVGAAQRIYARTLRAWLARRWLGPAAASAMLAALVILPFGHPWTFLPEMDGGLISVSLSLPPGSPLLETVEVVEAYERAIADIPGVETVLSTVGDQGSQAELSFSQLLGVHEAAMTLVLAPHAEREKSAQEIAREIASLRVREDVAVSIEADRTAAALGDDYFPGVTIHVTGSNLAALREASEAIRTRLGLSPGFGTIAISMDDPQPELFFNVTDRSFQGVLAGGEPLTAGQVGLALRNHLTGMTATHIVLDDVRLPVVLRPGREETATADALREFRVPGAAIRSSGAMPKLGQVANVFTADGPVVVDHLNRQRLVTIRGELDGIGLREAKAVALQTLEETALPPGITAEVAGIHRVIDETVGQMAGLLLIGIVLVYAVMAAQFESLKQPLILMLTVPLALVGAISAMRLFGLPFSVPAAIGMIVLVGIAVNNGIIMIDYINRLRRDGLSPVEAVIEGAVVRLRPILMTVLTTLMGLLPLAFSTGQGSEFQVPLAVVLIGGLTTSTALTLYILPSIVLLTSGRRPLRPVAGALVLATAVAALVGVHDYADAASSPDAWSYNGLAGAIVTDREAPAFVAGAGISRQFRNSRLSLDAAGGMGAHAPIVIGVRGGRYLLTFPGSVDISANAHIWLRPALAHEAEIALAWNGAHSRGRLSLANAAGARSPHPWSGRAALSDEQTWEASLNMEQPVTGSLSWDRDLAVWAIADQTPRWLLMNGVTVQAQGLIRTHVRGGLLLQSGKYDPLLKVDTTLTLLPQGEVDLTIAPHTGAVPLGWPVFGLGYRGRIGGLDLAVRGELGAPQSGFDRRGSLSIQPVQSPYTLRFGWTEADQRTGVIALHLAF